MLVVWIRMYVKTIGGTTPYCVSELGACTSASRLKYEGQRTTFGSESFLTFHLAEAGFFLFSVLKCTLG